MALGKKGYLFSLITIILLVSAAALMAIRGDIGFFERSEPINNRLSETNSLLRAIERDSFEALRISSIRGITGMIEYAIEEDDYPDIALYQEIVEYGTINGDQSQIMENSSLDEWFQNIRLLAAGYGYAVETTIEEITIEHKDPWTLETSLRYRVGLVDEETMSSWNREFLVAVDVSVERFLDPLMVVETQGYIQKKVKRLEETPGPNNIGSIVADTLYIESNQAPSFLKRLQGDKAPDVNFGIETLIDLGAMQDINLDFPNRNIVDHKYFDNIEGTCDLQSSLGKMSGGDAERYNVPCTP